MLYEKVISFSNIFKFEDNETVNFDLKKINISSNQFKKVMLDFDLKNYLSDNNLTKMDRASMKSGLEVRSPFLSKEIIDYVLKIDLNLRINKNKKFLITEILKKYIPKSLFVRPKKGFSIPLQSWLNGELNNWATDLLSKENLILIGIFNIEEVINTWKNKKKRNFYIYEYWNLIVYISWYKLFLLKNE
jgi:asparagine synthase (glutamine-hydrolysing)